MGDAAGEAGQGGEARGRGGGAHAREKARGLQIGRPGGQHARAQLPLPHAARGYRARHLHRLRRRRQVLQGAVHPARGPRAGQAQRRCRLRVDESHAQPRQVPAPGRLQRRDRVQARGHSVREREHRRQGVRRLQDGHEARAGHRGGGARAHAQGPRQG